MTSAPPGIAWLAARTGRDPAALTASPRAGAEAAASAVRELADLAARAASADPAVRDPARAELEALRAELDTAPPPGEVALSRIALGLRGAAERLRRDGD